MIGLENEYEYFIDNYTYIRTIYNRGEWIEKLNKNLQDSGQRTEFETGAVRECAPNKGRYDLISPDAIRRLAIVLEKGCDKYGARNFEKGLPMSRYIDSSIRHLYQYLSGMRDEDHLAQAMFNIMALIYTEEQVARGNLPASLNNLPDHTEKSIDKLA